jgi:hypothetical protein
MNIVTKLKELVRGQHVPTFRVTDEAKPYFRFLRTRGPILEELRTCKQQEKVVGIYAPVLGEGIFITGIEDVYDWEKETVVVLKPCDIMGNFLQRNYLSLSEIKSVCPFNCKYENPFIKTNSLDLR